MDITIREVASKKDRKTFIYLPEKIHAGHASWLYPLYMDDRTYFNPEKNEAFGYCDTKLILAYRGEEVVGRCMGIINNRYNSLKGEKTARFGYLETYEDFDVVKALVEDIEHWAREKGMTKIIGPYGFTDQDPEGFLIEGFEYHATLATYCNFPWMPPFIEKLGFDKDVDYFVYKIPIPKEMPELYKKVFERAQRKGHYEILEFKARKELKKWVVPIFHLMNECYTSSNIYGYTPLSEKEMNDLAKRYLPVVDPRFVIAVKAEGEVVAFIIGIPDMSKGINQARGRLFPFGFLKILKAAKTTKQLDLLLGAVKAEYRGKGLDALMGVKMIMASWEAGYEIMDTHHELESNVKVRAEMQRIGGELYKKYRVYRKSL